ncbi:uncharacterized protein FFC1_08630 [Fusarium fujikuroi]|nr:uncharacterized protein FFC1_08630 [Fusarium fujikuroi]
MAWLYRGYRGVIGGYGRLYSNIKLNRK